MTLADDLRAARSLIDTPEKWGKGHYEDGDGCLCAIGALAKVLGVTDPDNDLGPAEDALNDAVTVAPKGRYPWSAVDFNDHPDTTHADIMALFDHAITAAEERGR